MLVQVWRLEPATAQCFGLILKNLVLRNTCTSGGNLKIKNLGTYPATLTEVRCSTAPKVWNFRGGASDCAYVYSLFADPTFQNCPILLPITLFPKSLGAIVLYCRR